MTTASDKPTDNNVAGTRGSRHRSKRVTSGVSKKLNSSASASGTNTSLAKYNTATTMRIIRIDTKVAIFSA